MARSGQSDSIKTRLTKALNMTRYLHETGLGASPEIQFIGAGLQRPECILATASGKLFMSDRRGGIMVIAPDARQHLLGKSDLVPNGIALQRDGSFLVANLGTEGAFGASARTAR